MKKITVTVDSEAHANELEELLNRLEYVISVEAETEKGFSKEEQLFVKERLEHYKRNKKSVLTFEEFTAELNRRYGI